MNFEFIAPITSKENEKVERTHATLWGRAWTMLNNANLTAELRSVLWTKFANYISQMHNITVKAGKEMCPN
jgi:hypothetical protein